VAFAVLEGEKADRQTGYSHLWHAGCCVTFLIAYEIRGIREHDRPKAEASSRTPAALSGDAAKKPGGLRGSPGISQVLVQSP